MIIGVLEYGEVRVYAGEADALAEWGSAPEDLASQVIVLYAEDGAVLAPVIEERPRRWFGLARGRPGTAGLRRMSHDDFGVDLLGLAVADAVSMAPNGYFGSLQELRARFPLQ